MLQVAFARTRAAAREVTVAVREVVRGCHCVLRTVVSFFSTPPYPFRPSSLPLIGSISNNLIIIGYDLR